MKYKAYFVLTVNISNLGNVTIFKYYLKICIKNFVIVAYYCKSKLLNQTFKPLLL